MLLKKIHSIVGESKYNAFLLQYHKLERLMRLLSSPMRALPDFLILGAQKSGTTSLYRYLVSHPQVMGVYPNHPNGRTTWSKEIHYFNDNFNKHRYWYKYHFPLNSTLNQNKTLTGEGSPGYLYHPHVASRIADTVENPKLIIALRNPVDRAISHYWHQVKRGVENLTMKEAFEKEEERIKDDKLKIKEDNKYFGDNHKKFSYLDRGKYAEQIERYLKFFSMDQMLILKSEELFENTQAVFDNVTSFLDLPMHKLNSLESHNTGNYSKKEAGIKKELTEFYKPHNERLYNLLNLENPWW